MRKTITLLAIIAMSLFSCKKDNNFIGRIHTKGWQPIKYPTEHNGFSERDSAYMDICFSDTSFRCAASYFFSIKGDYKTMLGLNSHMWDNASFDTTEIKMKLGIEKKFNPSDVYFDEETRTVYLRPFQEQ